jgi:hypothetical protein
MSQAIELEGEESLAQHSSEDYLHISIKITKEQFSVFELKRRHEKQTLKMNPDFQREGNVWNFKQKSELIESILMGIPIPIIYFFEDEQGLKQVVDGRQRLSCLFDCLDNKLKLVDLKMLKSENGKKFDDLTPQLQAKIEDYQFLAYTIQHPTPERVKFDIFDRVNRGGTQLNNQEMRNALYLGKSTELLNSLAQSKFFLLATEKIVSTKRMKDRYIILRFLAFFLLQTKQLGNISYKSNIDDFLADVMKHINQFTDHEIKDLTTIFEHSMENCFDVLGKDAFRFDAKNGKRRPINMCLFESLSYLLSISLPNIDKLELKSEIKALKQTMDESRMFIGIINTSKGLNYRFNKVEEIRTRLKNA